MLDGLLQHWQQGIGLGIWLKLPILFAEKDRLDVKQRGEMAGGLAQPLGGGLRVLGNADLIEVGKTGNFVGVIGFYDIIMRIIQTAIHSGKTEIFKRRVTIGRQAGGKKYREYDGGVYQASTPLPRSC
ncbi:hypothetical protein [Profundibacter sp.]|uniref:hypothetical protein n=1 Tax=Profundibacter sp. TaxID=3101071 RepID=UPI003D0FD32E